MPFCQTNDAERADGLPGRRKMSEQRRVERATRTDD
jgi:hypothetical protein